MHLHEILAGSAAVVPTPASTPSSPGGQTTLTSDQTTFLVVAVLVLVVAIGVVIIVARSQSWGHGGGHKGIGVDLVGTSVVRSWIAIALVAGLMVLCAAAFAIADTTLRSTLIGGLTASVGSAIAYYFASKSSEQSTAAVLQATTSTATVPDLVGKSQSDAITALGAIFVLGLDPSASTGAAVTSQNPVAGSTATLGSPVVIKLG